MRTLKFIFIGSAIFFLSSKLIGQQLPQYSLYMYNPYIVNPAYAGLENELQVRSTTKYQWTGITDAPRTFNLSFSNTALDAKMGYGAWVYTDVAGPTRRIGVQGSANYLSNITESLKFSIALSGGISQYAIDGDKIIIRDTNDPILNNTLSSKVIFDAKVGFFLYHKKYFLGLSVPNLTQSRIDPFFDGQSIGVLEPHFNLMAGYNYILNDDITLKPSMLLKYVEPAPFKIDINLLFDYKNRFWFGGGYRINDGIIALVGVDLNNRMQFSYAFDIITSNLSSYSGGVHEISIGLNFTKPEPKLNKEVLE